MQKNQKMITPQERVAFLNSRRYKKCNEVASKILARLANEDDSPLNRSVNQHFFGNKMVHSKNADKNFFRYLVSRLVIGVFKQVTNAAKFLYFLRCAIFETPWSKLIDDARYIINDVDAKIAETYTYFTTQNLSKKLDLLQHRIKTSFSLCFADHRTDLTRYFRLNLQVSDHYLSGSEILEDISWEDTQTDQDIKELIMGIISDLNGHDIMPHEIENIVKVFPDQKDNGLSLV